MRKDLDEAGGRGLYVPVLPKSYRDQVLHHLITLHVGVAGLMLLAAAAVRGVKMSFFVLPAVAVVLFGHALGLPAIGPVSALYTSLAAGALLFLLGLLFGRQHTPA